MNISDSIRQVMKKKNISLSYMAKALGKKRGNDISARLTAHKNLSMASAIEMLEVLDYELVIQERRPGARREDQIVITLEEDNKSAKVENPKQAEILAILDEE